ncbi:MAG: protein-export membrane protein SecF [Paenibacillus sp. RIFOXYA1_FULL_44_5]|nr:MAG: protein-export membrane protein SecF [Paenibacillus sp. RIFOXYA1_FULL_44_5]
MLSKQKFSFMKQRNKLFILSSTITILGILTLLIFGLNFGVDFKAGTALDISAGKTVEKAEIQQIIDQQGYKQATITIGGTKQDRASIRFDGSLNSDQIAKFKKAVTDKYGAQTSYEESTVFPDIANELGVKAMIAVLVASLGIIIYVTIRFEWRFAIAAIVALLHDVFIVVSLFSIFHWQVNLPFLAAVLTIIGYSINDTIVIFDRIRENLRFSKLKTEQDLMQMIDHSIWQTMTRSINTLLTVLIGAVLLLIMGSESIRYFSLAMVLGLVSGGYSSIFIASPIWFLLKRSSLKSKRVEVNAKA